MRLPSSIFVSVSLFTAETTAALYLSSTYRSAGDQIWQGLTLLFTLVPSVLVQLTLTFIHRDLSRDRPLVLLLHILQLGPIVRQWTSSRLQSTRHPLSHGQAARPGTGAPGAAAAAGRSSISDAWRHFVSMGVWGGWRSPMSASRARSRCRKTGSQRRWRSRWARRRGSCSPTARPSPAPPSSRPSWAQPPSSPCSSTSASCSSECPSGESGSPFPENIEKTLTRVGTTIVLCLLTFLYAGVNMFCWSAVQLKLNDPDLINKSQNWYRMAVYYMLRFVENATLILLWYVFQTDFYRFIYAPLLVLQLLVGYAIGIFFMLVFYQLCHPCKKLFSANISQGLWECFNFLCLLCAIHRGEGPAEKAALEMPPSDKDIANDTAEINGNLSQSLSSNP
ncbi:endoplasmic reticulum membrane adapter protein XK-like isoform X2 [Conger conger]|uniref:endoplasmic reticulum membrane adapter protein XK-like isoform X2 n=1 Tax=Conger conger TaxID=82655 RepID=UPI002A59BE4A|nr:endoplasmic reticulum membrane adapter protein XK-like isoform X2 [Conger conger]